MKDYFGFQGKKVVITGAASGMGHAATEMLLDLGAEVYTMDVREVDLPVKKQIVVDLLDLNSINAAIEQLPEEINTLISCAGIPGTTYMGGRFTEADVVTVNFLAPRHLIDTLYKRMPEGSAIGVISSGSGMSWAENTEILAPLLETPDFESGRAWLDDPDNDTPITEDHAGYHFSKEAIIFYCKARSADFSYKGIRLNVISPGSTNTGMKDDFVKLSGQEAFDSLFMGNGRAAEPREMGEPLVFLCSDMASYISGVNLAVDYSFEAYTSTMIAVDLPPLE